MMQSHHTETVLVTGANGRLGRFLRRAWAGAPPGGLRPLYMARSGPAELRWPPGDAPLPRCGTVIALWGCTPGGGGDLTANAALADAARELALRCRALRVIHMSSAAVYGPGEALGEARPPAPATAYGRAKLEMEGRVAGFVGDGPVHCCLRLANVVGADSLAPALRAGPVHLDRFADGHGPQRSCIAPGDLAAVLAALATLPAESLPATLNIAAPRPVSMAGLARAAGQDIRWRPAPAGTVQRVTLATSRARALLPKIAYRMTAAAMVGDWQALEAAP